MHRYSIFLPMLGEGSFGQVFKAKRKGSNEIVALKLIKKHGRTEKELLSLRRECEIQRHFKHPNIIQMLDSFETEGEIGVVTECAYKDLYHILATEGYLNEERAGRITSDLVSALYYLHSNRVLHRDLKPQNVLLSETGVVKLCDFGFARNMSVGTHVLTSIKGTPLYMAPELMEENPYDHNADLWSLGCIVYEMIVGCPPFKTNNILHLVNMIRREPIRWPEFTSPDCLSLLRGLLQKNPSVRLSWPHLLEHPFVRGNVLITSDQGVTLPLTAELTASQAFAKELQKQDLKAAGMMEANLEKRRFSNKLMDEKRELYYADEVTYPRPELKPDFDDEDLLRRLRCMETNDGAAVNLGEGTMHPNQKEVKEILKLDEGCQEVCLSALESEEWLVFLRESLLEVMDGDGESVGDQAFVNMVCRALTSSSPSVVEYIACLFSIPFAADSFDEVHLEKIRKAYSEVKLVPRLIYATQLITKRAKAASNLNADELQALEVIFLLVSNLVHTEEVFLEQFCKISLLMSLPPHYAFILSLRRRKVRIAVNLLAIMSHVLRKMPEYKCIVVDFIRTFENPEGEFRSMLNHNSESLVIRTLIFIRELSSRCTDFAKSLWSDCLQRDIEALRYSPNEELRSIAESVLIHLLEIGVLMENIFIQQEASAE